MRRCDRSQVVIVPKDGLAKVGIVMQIANKLTLVERSAAPHIIILNERVELPIFDLYRLDLYRRGQPIFFDVQEAQPAR
jgi:hypothetical protein